MKKQTVLDNKIHKGDKAIAIKAFVGFNIGFFILLSFITLIAFLNLPNEINDGLITLIIGDFLLLLALVLFFKKKYVLAKNIVILTPPYTLFIASLLLKYHGYLLNIYTFLTPKFLSILFLMVPIIFFGLREKKNMIIGLILLSPTIIFFDFLHRLIGIDIDHLPINNLFYPLFIGILSIFYTFVLLSLLFVEKSNLLYKEKINFQKDIITKDKEELNLLIEQNSLIASNINDFVWMFDMDLNVKYVSPSCYKFTGYTEEELLNIDFKKLHTKESNFKIANIVSSAKNIKLNTNQVTTEIDYIKKDGSHFVAEVVGKGIFDSKGNKTAIVGVSRDITERKEREKELVFQSNLYKILDITSKNKPLVFVLQEVLDQLLTLEGLDIKHKGLIFLTNEKEELEIAAHTNVEALLSMCSSVKKGQCLCGKVLESKQKMFCDQVDHKHDIIPPNMKPHGHYVTPILHNNKVVGVINIYIAVNQIKDPRIETFLETVAQILARKIVAEKNKEQLKKQQIEISQHKNVIESTLNELNQSIDYAKFLQSSLMPNQDTINQFFNESCVLFLPKDKVSGDFYFAHEIDNKLFFGVGDCTGHGIPGSMLAAMSVEAVKYLVETRSFNYPNAILNELREVAKKRFSVNLYDKRSDSMDAGMCMYDKKSDKLFYSGGLLNLMIVRNNSEIIEYKATKCPVGSYPVEYDFELNEIDLQKGDVIYLASDGFVDQFGYPDDKNKPTKFKRKRFRELLIRISSLSCDEQVKTLENTLHNWRKTIDQIDDVTVFIAKH